MSDYGEPPSELVIEVGDTMDCIDITTVNDNIYEEDEQFFITLSSATDGVGIAQDTATVEITDNDGKTTLLYRFEFVCLLYMSTYVFNSIDVTVRWNQSVYLTSEGSTLVVCAEQPEQTERAFSVNVIIPSSEGIRLVSGGI